MRFDVFLSHSIADAAEVEKLAHKLRDAGVTLFLDRWQLVPGEPWQEALEQALSQSAVCAVLIGKEHGRWQNEEMRSALERKDVRVIPVLLPDSKEEDLPLFLRRRTRIDFRTGLDDGDAFRRLLAGIRGEAPVPEPAADLPLLKRALPPVYFRDPPTTAAVFTGRSREMGRLSDWLASSESMFIWAALGGQGKTALVSNWYRNEPLLRRGWEGIVWWSFYAPASLPDEFARFALKRITGDLPEATPRQHFDQLAAELRNRRFLVILDGLERTLRGYVGTDAPGTIDLDVALEADELSLSDLDFEWFLRSMTSAIPNSVSKILITTRDVPAGFEDLGGCTVERLQDLSEDEATEYLRTVGIAGESHELAKAFASYGRHPLGLKLLAGLVDEDLKAPRNLKALRKLELPVELKDKRSRHHILEHAYRAMSEAERGLLGRLSLYRTVISFSMLQVFGGVYPLKETLKKLVVRGFVERDGGQINMHPIVQQFARQQFLITAPSEAAFTHRIIADFYQAETGEELADEFRKVPLQDERYVGPLRKDAAEIRSIDEVAPTIELVYHLLSGGETNRAVVLLRDRLSHLLVYKFHAFRILKDLLDPAFLGHRKVEPVPPADDKQAWAINILGNCYRYCVSACEAAVLHEAVVRWDERNAEHLFSVRLVNLAIDQELIGDFQEAEKNFLRALAIARSLELSSNVVSCLRELGRLHTRAGRLSEAGEFLAEALQLARELGSRYLPGVLINHSHLYLVQGDVPRALEKAREAEGASIAIHGLKLMNERHAIAVCLMATGTLEHREEAGRLLREALDEAGRDDLAVIQLELLLALAQWLGFGPEALCLAERALSIAVDGDYVPFESDAQTVLGEIEMTQGNLSRARRHANQAMLRSSQRKDPRTRAYANLTSEHVLHYELGQRRAAELLQRLKSKNA